MRERERERHGTYTRIHRELVSERLRKKERERNNTDRHTHKEREKQERTTEAMFLSSDHIANFQGERAESAQLRSRLLQINVLLQVLPLLCCEC